MEIKNPYWTLDKISLLFFYFIYIVSLHAIFIYQLVIFLNMLIFLPKSSSKCNFSSVIFWPRFYIVVLGMTFFLQPIQFLFSFSTELLFPFSIWTFFLFFLFFISFSILLLFDRGQILDIFQKIFNIFNQFGVKVSSTRVWWSCKKLFKLANECITGKVKDYWHSVRIPAVILVIWLLRPFKHSILGSSQEQEQAG